MGVYDYLKDPHKNQPAKLVAFSDLSGSLDSGKSFQRRLQIVAANATDFEKSTGIVYLYEIFGSNWFRSLSVAMDPTRPFKDTRKKISPITRYRSGGFRGQFGSIIDTTNRETESTTAFVDIHYPVPEYVVSDISTQWSVEEFNASGFEWVIGDTTFATRPDGIDEGEFEMYIPNSSTFGPSSVVQTSEQRIYWQYLDGEDVDQSVYLTRLRHARTVTRVNIGGVSLAFDPVDYAAYEREVGMYYILPYYLPRLLANALPGKRSFQGLYSIYELKDVPRMLKGTLEAILSSPARWVKQPGFAANQYLNYKFGWESVLRDIREMMSLPTSITKRINYLISRSGKDTTYRSKVLLDSLAVPGISPTFSYNLASFEEILTQSTSIERTGEIRCVVNNSLTLPELSVPELSASLHDKLWGLTLTPEDIYNIIPWSWLVDYFTGLGEYIRVITELQQDRLVINYGFMTYVSKVKGVHNLTTGVTNGLSTYYLGDPQEDGEFVTTYSYGSTFEYKYQLRVDMASLDGVKSYWNPDSLSASQQAIIAALVASRVR